MKYSFCTLFAKNYLFKGLALYNSLKRNCQEFSLYILCMDGETYDLLKKLNLENVILVPLSEFEDEELARIKNTRSLGEYCWTCTASLVLYLLKKYQDLEMMSYLDADLLFFSDPAPIFEELGNGSILITEHNFSKEFKRLAAYGKYNVQFVVFRNDRNALEALERWRTQTIDWCYSRGGDKKGGDQIYLNDWPERFKGVHVLQNNKLCLAPWSADQYRVDKKDGSIYVEGVKLVFYHFHSFDINAENKFHLAAGSYRVGRMLKALVYRQYIEEIKWAIGLVAKVDPAFRFGFVKISLKDRLKDLRGGLIYGIFRLINKNT